MIFLSFLAFALSSACPHGTDHIYDSEVSVLLNKSQWYYFYTTLLHQNIPLQISAKANTSVSIYKGRNSGRPSRWSKRFMTAGTYLWSTKELTSKKDNQVVAFGAYAESPTKLDIKVNAQNVERKKATNTEIVSSFLVFATIIVYVIRYVRNHKKSNF